MSDTSHTPTPRPQDPRATQTADRPPTQPQAPKPTTPTPAPVQTPAPAEAPQTESELEANAAAEATATVPKTAPGEGEITPVAFATKHGMKPQAVYGLIKNVGFAEACVVDRGPGVVPRRVLKEAEADKHVAGMAQRRAQKLVDAQAELDKAKEANKASA